MRMAASRIAWRRCSLPWRAALRPWYCTLSATSLATCEALGFLIFSLKTHIPLTADNPFQPLPNPKPNNNGPSKAFTTRKNRPKAVFCQRRLGFVTHMRKQDHIPNRRRIGQQHDQAVDADAFTGGRRHAVL